MSSSCSTKPFGKSGHLPYNGRDLFALVNPLPKSELRVSSKKGGIIYGEDPDSDGRWDLD
jgi:hypothetical protein